MRVFHLAQGAWLRSMVVAILVPLAVTGCIDTAAVSELATTGSEVATTLAQVYDLIRQSTRDAEAVSAAQDAFVGSSTSTDNALGGLSYADLEKPLEARIVAAQQLGRVYQAFGTVASPKLPETAATAATGLATALQGVVHITAGFDPIPFFKLFADAIAQWKADQDIHRALDDVRPAAGLFATFYDRERPSYRTLLDGRRRALRAFASSAVSIGIVQRDALLRFLSDIYGLPIASPVCPGGGNGQSSSPTPAACNAAAVAVLRLRADQAYYASERAIDTMGVTLHLLAQAYESAGSGLSTTAVRAVQRSLADAQAYAKAAADFRGAPSTSH